MSLADGSVYLNCTKHNGFRADILLKAKSNRSFHYFIKYLTTLYLNSNEIVQFPMAVLASRDRKSLHNWLVRV